MRKLIYSLASIATLSLTAIAGPLQKDLVSADAKWLVHLDLDAFRATKVGQYVAREIVEKRLEKPKANIKQAFNFDLDWTKLKSITAYGTDYQSKPEANGILIIDADAKMREGLEALIKGQSSGGGSLPIALVEGESSLYDINKSLYLSLQKEGPMLLGKSRNQLQKAGEVISGKKSNLSSGKSFKGLLNPSKAFFFLGVAEGFGETALKDQTLGNMPPQAKIFQMADAGRIALSESPEQLLLSLVLTAKTADASQEMQQVVQGLIALVSLSQTENKDLMQLVQGAKVSSSENQLKLDIGYPIDKVLEKIGQNTRMAR